MKSKYFILLMFLILQEDVFSQAVGTPFTPFLIPKGLVVSKTGRIWMDKNLGAKRVATSTYDSLSYGFYFQWGREADGHQERGSGLYYHNGEYYKSLANNSPFGPGIYRLFPTMTQITQRESFAQRDSNYPLGLIQSSSDNPNHNQFIAIFFGNDQNIGNPQIGYNGVSGYDWRFPSNNNLWQGVNGVNNPCPLHFRVPTKDEWQAEINTWDFLSQAAFNSNLRLPNSSFRSTGGYFPTLNNYHYPPQGNFGDRAGQLWSSTTLTFDKGVTNAYIVGYNDIDGFDTVFESQAYVSPTYKGYGMPVRCILDQDYSVRDLTLGDYSIYSDYSHWHP